MCGPNPKISRRYLLLFFLLKTSKTLAISVLEPLPRRRILHSLTTNKQSDKQTDRQKTNRYFSLFWRYSLVTNRYFSLFSRYSLVTNCYFSLFWRYSLVTNRYISLFSRFSLVTNRNFSLFWRFSLVTNCYYIRALRN